MIRTSSLAGGGPSVAQAIFLEDTQPIDVTIYGRRYLQSGYVETDTRLFDTDIFTDKSFINPVEQTTGFSGDSVYSSLYAGGLYLITGANGKLATSPDAVTWTIQDGLFTSVERVNCSVYGDGLYVIGGGGGKISTSADGSGWTASTTTFAGQQVIGLTYSGTLFVAVGNLGNISTSPDGITWTARVSGTINGLNGVTYADGTYVAVGGGGDLLSSTNGISWTARTSGFGSDNINDVFYGNGLFVAVGNTGKIATSPDGIAWTQQTSGFGTSAIYGVTFGNDNYIITGQSGKIATSTDAVTWTIKPTTQTGLISCIVANETLTLTGGDTLYTSNYINYAGSTEAYSENNENQYIRIT